MFIIPWTIKNLKMTGAIAHSMQVSIWRVKCKRARKHVDTIQMEEMQLNLKRKKTGCELCKR